MTDSELDKLTSTPLQVAYRNARRTPGGPALVQKTLAAHGSTTGVLSDVPEAKRASCLIALTKIANGDKQPTEEAAFADMRAKAYGTKAKPAAVKSFADLTESAYARFNNPPAKAKPTSET